MTYLIKKNEDYPILSQNVFWDDLESLSVSYCDPIKMEVKS